MTLTEDIKKTIEFEHIGIAVSDITECLNIIGNLFELKEVSEIYEDILQNIKVSFINLSGAKVELIEPLDRSKESPVDNMLKRNNSYYHLCFSTKCIADTVSELKEKGAIEVCSPVPALAFGNSKIAFLFIKHLGLIELVEKK